MSTKPDRRTEVKTAGEERWLLGRPLPHSP
jgi:hypothetical protein